MVLLGHHIEGTAAPSALETHQEKSSEVDSLSIPVLEHGKLHVGRGRVSELNILITIAISPRASLEP